MIEEKRQAYYEALGAFRQSVTQFVASARFLDSQAKEFDPDGKHECALVNATVEAATQELRSACVVAPGIRHLLAEALGGGPS